MADQQYLRTFSFEHTGEGSAVIESGGSLQKVAAGGGGEKIRKTVWQNVRTPPVIPGDTFTVDGTLATCERVSVTDEVISIDGRTPVRLWKIDIEGHAGGPGTPEDLEASSGKYLEGYSSEIPRNSFVIVEDNGTLAKHDGPTVRTTLSKTVWQTNSIPPVETGAGYSFNGVSGIVERVSVSDEVISIAGGTPTRLWKFEIEGFAGSEDGDEDLEGASGRYFEEHGSEIPRREFILVEDGGNLEKLDGAPVRRELSKTVWQTDPIPPVAAGAAYSFNGVSGIVERISVSDEVLSIADGVPARLWKFEIEGFAGSENGDADLESAGRKYFETTEISESVSEGISYEDFTGSPHVVREPGAGRRVSKTVWQQTMVPPLSVGDPFSAGGITAACTRISITDEVLAVEGGVPVRLWRIDLDGVEGGTASPARYLRERNISRKLNGAVETALDGETVILQRSGTPVTTVSVSCYSETEDPPVAVGAAYEGGIVTGVDSVRTVVDVEGMQVAELWRHSIEVAR